MAAMPDSLRALLAFAVCAAAFLLPPVASMADDAWRAWLWGTVAAIAVATGTLYVLYRPNERRQERQAKGQCVRCGYDLTGNVSGVCPECGAGVAPRVAERE